MNKYILVNDKRVSYQQKINKMSTDVCIYALYINHLAKNVKHEYTHINGCTLVNDKKGKILANDKRAHICDQKVKATEGESMLSSVSTTKAISERSQAIPLSRYTLVHNGSNKFSVVVADAAERTINLEALWQDYICGEI